MYQDADWDAKARKDAIGRLLHFLRAKVAASTDPYVEATYSFAETRPLRLEVIHSLRPPIRMGGELGVWTLTNADGDAVSVDTMKAAP
jgi:hypothetical protein